MDVFLSGYYGYGNLGDDIFLYVLLKDFLNEINYDKVYTIVWDIGNLPQEILQLFDKHQNWVLIEQKYASRLKRYLNLLKGFSKDLVIFGGGTFLFDDVKAQVKTLFVEYILVSYSVLMNSKIIGLGIGCDELKSKFSKVIAKGILQNIDKIYFRDKSSLNNALNLKRNLNKYTVMPDLAYLIFPELEQIRYMKNVEKERPVVGINLACFTIEEKILSNIIKLIDELIKLNVDIRLITVQNNSLSQEWKINKEVKKYYHNIQEIKYQNSIFNFLHDLANLDFIIASKLHLVISAHLLNIPCIALPYQQKVESICKEIINKEYIADLSRIEVITDYIVKHSKLRNRYEYAISPEDKYKNLCQTLSEIKVSLY